MCNRSASSLSPAPLARGGCGWLVSRIRKSWWPPPGRGRPSATARQRGDAGVGMTIHILDDKPYIRPCPVIPEESTEHNDWASVSISTRYEQLTTLLPLTGAAMMTATHGGDEPKIAAALRAEAPWMDAAVDIVAEHVVMSLWAGRPWIAVPPILLVGPPGAGKSHFARRLGELSGCEDAVLSFAGINSNAELAGNPRGFKQPQASFPVCVMQRLRTGNPVLVIDEVEKTSINNIGDRSRRCYAARTFHRPALLRWLLGGRDRPFARQLDPDREQRRALAGAPALAGARDRGGRPRARACRGSARNLVAGCRPRRRASANGVADA